VLLSIIYLWLWLQINRQGSSVGVVIRLRSQRTKTWIGFLKRAEVFLSPQFSNRLWGQLSLVPNRHPAIGLELHLLRRSRYISTSSYLFIAWCLIKHSNNNNFTYKPVGLFLGGGANKFSWERGSGGGSPLVRDSGGSCNWHKKSHFI